MGKDNYTVSGNALSGLILELFRLNNRLLATGDRLVAELGLTSARWKVLGTIIAAGRPQPVAWLARDMGGNRQNVQRIVNDLVNDGLVEFQPNPHHRKAQWVVLTAVGRQAFDNAMRLQAPWINELAEGLRVNDIETTHHVITVLCKRLEGDSEIEER
jgi:DNA-binding MarR family transcriptional regulator